MSDREAMLAGLLSRVERELKWWAENWNTWPTAPKESREKSARELLSNITAALEQEAAVKRVVARTTISPAVSATISVATAEQAEQWARADRAHKLAQLKPGVQVTYVPTHAEGDVGHLDSEDGFVSLVRDDAESFVFCRFWSKFSEGELRTKSCSESTPIDCLVIRDTRPQELVDSLLAELGYTEKEGQE